MKIKSDRQLVITSENISVPSLQFTWRTQKESEENEDPRNQNDLKSNMKEANTRVIGGFLLKWQLLGSNQDNYSANIEGKSSSLWKTKREEDRDMLTIMNLARQRVLKRRRFGKHF